MTEKSNKQKFDKKQKPGVLFLMLDYIAIYIYHISFINLNHVPVVVKRSTLGQVFSVHGHPFVLIVVIHSVYKKSKTYWTFIQLVILQLSRVTLLCTNRIHTCKIPKCYGYTGAVSLDLIDATLFFTVCMLLSSSLISTIFSLLYDVTTTKRAFHFHLSLISSSSTVNTCPNLPSPKINSKQGTAACGVNQEASMDSGAECKCILIC